MSKLIQRILIFVVGLPAVLSVVYFFPQMHHLTANILTIIASSIGAAEFAVIVSKRGYSLHWAEASVLGAALPLAASIRISFSIQGEWELYALIFASLWILSSRVFSRSKDLDSASDRIVSAFACLLYPGAFLLWIVRLNGSPDSSALLLLFLAMVFGNDSIAWFTGMLFGKGNRGIIPASPNKSVAGFIGGIGFSVASGAVAASIMPDTFASSVLPGPIAGAALGLLCGVASVVGDLAESTIKRSADVKDSGSIIPGRGGILESIDSIAFAAPVFFAAYSFLFAAH
jgi:phosphatidate cytidylyltransferase